MTIDKETIVWNDGKNILKLTPVKKECQYIYKSHIPCITFGICYENVHFKGCDTFTLFDNYYSDFLNVMENCENARLEDCAADTDGYIDFAVSQYGKIIISGQLGSSFSDFSLKFSFDADQTVFASINNALKIK